MTSPPPVLRDIIASKRDEVARAKARTALAELEHAARNAEPARNLFAAVTRRATAADTAVIAEITRASPSAGWIRPGYDDEGFRPEVIAQRYHAHGAAAISCPTDESILAGRLEWIRRVKDAVPLPVLRRDFILDPWQVWESRAAGADAILLIAECLNESEILDLSILSQRLGMTILLEIHEMDSLLRYARHVGFPHPSYGLLAINNRDLVTGRVDINHTLRLAELVEDRGLLVSDSGMTSRDDLRRLRRVGVRIVLEGEHFMKHADPGAALRLLKAGSATPAF